MHCTVQELQPVGNKIHKLIEQSAALQLVDLLQACSAQQDGILVGKENDYSDFLFLYSFFFEGEICLHLALIAKTYFGAV